MVDTEASQSGDGFSLYQILQTDGTLATILTEHVRYTHTHTHKASISVSRLLKTQPYGTFYMTYVLL